MQVQCPSCGKRYALPADKVQGERLKVQCAGCGAKFVVRIKRKAPVEGASAPTGGGAEAAGAPWGGEGLADDDISVYFGDTQTQTQVSSALGEADVGLDQFFGATEGEAAGTPVAGGGDEADDPFAAPAALAEGDAGLGFDVDDADAADLFGSPDDLDATVGGGAEESSEDLFGSPEDVFGEPESEPASAGSSVEVPDLFGADEETEPPGEQSEDDALAALFDEETDEDLFGDTTAETDAAAKPEMPDFEWDDETEEPAAPVAAGGEATLDDLQLRPGLDEAAAQKVLEEVVETETPSGPHPARLLRWFVLLVLLAGVAGAAIWPPARTRLEALVQTALERWGPRETTEIEVVHYFEPVGEPRLRRVQNRNVGTLLVVEGAMRNTDRQPRSFLKLRLRFVDESGRTVTETSVYAGNQLSSFELRKFPPDALREKLAAEPGKELANVNIAPGATVPFTAFFVPDPRPEGRLRLEVEELSSVATPTKGNP